MSDEKIYHSVILRVDDDTWELIENLKKATGLSAREILGYSSQPCKCCPDAQVRPYNSQDKAVSIKRGILYDALLTKYQSYDKNEPNRIS